MGVNKFWSQTSDLFPNSKISNGRDKIHKKYLFIELNPFLHMYKKKSIDDLVGVVMTEIDRVVKVYSPLVLFLVIDGPGPIAKMPVQILRRQKNEGRARLTPGTETIMEFENKLMDEFENFTNGRPQYQKMEVIFSFSNVPGEGEYKIAKYISDYNDDISKTSCAIITTDSDLFLLGMMIPNCIVVQQNTPLNFVQHDMQIVRNFLRAKIEYCENFQEIMDDLFFLSLFCGNDYLNRINGINLIGIWGRYLGGRKIGKWSNRKLFRNIFSEKEYIGKIDLEMLWDVIESSVKRTKAPSETLTIGPIELRYYSSSLSITAQNLLRYAYPRYHTTYTLDGLTYVCIIADSKHKEICRGSGISKTKAIEKIYKSVLKPESKTMKKIQESITEEEFSTLTTVLRDIKDILEISSSKALFEREFNFHEKTYEISPEGKKESAIRYLKDILWVYNYSKGSKPHYYYQCKSSPIFLKDFYELAQNQKEITVSIDFDETPPPVPILFSLSIMEKDLWSTCLPKEIADEFQAIDFKKLDFYHPDKLQISKSMESLKEKGLFQKYQHYFNLGTEKKVKLQSQKNEKKYKNIKDSKHTRSYSTSNQFTLKKIFKIL